MNLYDYGFKTKASMDTWIRDNTVSTVGGYKRHGWWDFQTSGQVGSAVESTTGKLWRDLPDDFPYRAFNSISIIVSNIGTDEAIEWYSVGGTAHPIDVWR